MATNKTGTIVFYIHDYLFALILGGLTLLFLNGVNDVISQASFTFSFQKFILLWDSATKKGILLHVNVYFGYFSGFL
jgi:hypothetical protein